LLDVAVGRHQLRTMPECSERPQLSIVLVSWNTRDDLKRCIESIVALTYGVEYEVIVVDNSSSDGTQDEIRAGFPHVRLLENNKNVGFARAANQGMAASRGEQLLLLNSDTYVKDNVIGRAVARLLERPEIGMLGCQLRYPDGRLQHTANRAVTIRRSLFERLWLYKLLPPSRRPGVLLGGYWEHDDEVEVDWLAAAFMLLRRSLFEQTGGFDERFFMYGEDSEWCTRLGKLGHRILFTPAPGTVFHTGSVSSAIVWTEKDRLRRCYQCGLESYSVVNGPILGACYHLTELCGSVIRFLAYRALNRLRPSRYYAQQIRFYRWLIGFYVLLGSGRR
jgi:GT2 family glycosyltransferase